MGVAGAGGCCCCKCCKPKDWRFNYPYYIKGQPNPWKLDGRPLDPNMFKLVDWSKNGRWSVVAYLPDGFDCRPDGNSDGQGPHFIQGFADKAVRATETTPLSIRITARSDVTFGIIVFIVPCSKNSLVEGVGGDQHPYVDRNSGVYVRPFDFMASLAGGYYDNPPLCTSYTMTVTDAIQIRPGRYTIKLQVIKPYWYGKANATITFQGLSAENECP